MFCAVVTAERENVSFVTNTSGVQTADERLKTKTVQDAHMQHLKVPRRWLICYGAGLDSGDIYRETHENIDCRIMTYVYI